MRDGIIRFAAGGVLAILCLSLGVCRTADALEVVLNDVAADRVERQRRFIRNELPLPGTPDLTKLDERLKTRDLAEGRPIYIRIFKAESELELWMQNSKGTFTRLATYPICHWYGTLGPKLKEGDKQSPEGFYRVGAPQTRLVGRWRKAFNLGFPNTLDQKLDRTGSYILLHGGCSSVGCFAMTDPVQDEIYDLARAAIAKGQERFSVHVFPFRMTAANMAHYAKHEGSETWADLKPAYDSFERTRVPPQVALCGTRYKIADGLPGESGGTDRRLPVLRPISTDDPATTRDPNGAWVAPACQFDDEERRIAFYSGGTVGASATTTATTGKIVEASDEPSPPPSSRKASEHRHARPHHETKEAAATSRPAVAPVRFRAPSRPFKRGTTPPRRITAAPPADGFGSSALRGTLRISAHGG
jgi:murein L,D-transpeptidase YafK